jgi:hypothetical protein
MKVIAARTSLVVFGMFFGFVGRAAENEKRPPVSKPLVAISGADSHVHVRKPSYERVTTPEDWARIWISHLGTTKDDAYRPLLEVDFDRCLVVVIFGGERINIRRIEIDSLSENTNSIVIRFTELGYQTDGADNNKPSDRPYAFIIVPKTNKSIVLERNLANLGVQAPEWKEVARLGGG